ncbi:NAD-dependent histone deacetylase [Saccharomycopsis crataegensis]|uniref:NAD-dependent histone deacetylase n=1 Tax=Saccharomycopsis crataegensis TaxID=43959 RepID=A0AAV5QMW6_9ASCO|nr:NAD-dependent histone deacetylase [Saccharomycopsis crataegensis]
MTPIDVITHPDTMEVPVKSTNPSIGIKKSRKPKLKYRPETTSTLDLNTIDFSQPLMPQMTNDEFLNNLYFLNYALSECRKIVCVSGAGMSVAAGIPDFRSSNGLFQGGISVEKKKQTGDTTTDEDNRRYPKRDPSLNSRGSSSSKQLFTSNVYSDSSLTPLFHNLILNLHKIISQTQPTKFHNFLNDLSENGRLLRLYTQNIDCLDTDLPHLSTVTPLHNCLKQCYPKTIQLHGSLMTMCCSKCQWISNMTPSVFSNPKPVECPECRELNSVRSIVGKRTQTSGIIRPRFVLYNEFHPDGEIIGKITEHDLKKNKPDCLVVVGTSLKIPGVRRLVKEMTKVVKSQAGGCVIWVNLEKPSSADLQFMKELDLVVVGDCQKVPELMEKLKREEVYQTAVNKRKLKNFNNKITKPGREIQGKIIQDRSGKLVNLVNGAIAGEDDENTVKQKRNKKLPYL